MCERGVDINREREKETATVSRRGGRQKKVFFTFDSTIPKINCPGPFGCFPMRKFKKLDKNHS